MSDPNYLYLLKVTDIKKVKFRAITLFRDDPEAIYEKLKIPDRPSLDVQYQINLPWSENPLLIALITFKKFKETSFFWDLRPPKHLSAKKTIKNLLSFSHIGVHVSVNIDLDCWDSSLVPLNKILYGNYTQLQYPIEPLLKDFPQLPPTPYLKRVYLPDEYYENLKFIIKNSSQLRTLTL